MKIKADYVKTEAMDGMFMVVPVGDASTEHQVIELNETAAMIYDGFAEGLDESGIAERLMAEYGIGRERALAAVSSVADKLTAAGVME